jgi:SOS-response transcriptional repressor LexA
MAHFGEQIKKLRQAKHMTLEQLAARADVSYKQAWTWEQLETPRMQGRNYKALAEAIGMSTGELDKAWRSQKIEQSIGDPVRRGIPVINKAPAGRVIDFDECGPDTGIGHWYIDREGITDPNAFAVVITGDSMNKTFKEGDFVIFLPCDPDGHTHNGRVPVPDGHICYVRFAADSKHEGCTVAELWRGKDGKVKLVKENKKYSPMTVGAEEIASVAAYASLRRNGLSGQVRTYQGREQHQVAGGREGQLHPSEEADPIYPD